MAKQKDKAPPAPASEHPDDDAVVPVTEQERGVLATLEVAYRELAVAIEEYENACAKGGKQPEGTDSIMLTYRDAKNLQVTASALETGVRVLAARYRDDLVAAMEEAALRAQEPFTGRERGMLRVAIKQYAEALTSESGRLAKLERGNESRTLLGDAATLADRILPLFQEQLRMPGIDQEPLFGGGVARVTERDDAGKEADGTK